MNKTVLITGASRGIGRAIAIAFAKKQFRLVLACRTSADEIKEVQKQCIEMGSLCKIFIGDLGDSKEVSRLFEEVSQHFGGVDILINNAGISYIGLLSEMRDEDWNSVVSSNLNSVFYCSKNAIPHMVQQKKGHIINISSIWGCVGASCEVAYATTKGGINAFTKSLAKELAPSNIYVNALALGMIDTDMNRGFDEEELQDFVDDIPMGRMGRPEEIADLVVSMSEGFGYLTGQVIVVDGGYL